jgi:signal transduction histidine kinase
VSLIPRLRLVFFVVLCAASSCVVSAPTTAQGLSAANVELESLLERDSRPLMDYSITSFGPKEGAPPQVSSIAQTPDGFLWLASAQGLVRFDGARFVADDHVHGFVSSIASDSKGGVWLGYKFGGIGRLYQGRYEDASRGFPSRTTLIIVVDRMDVVWAQTTVGVFKFEGGSWSQVGPSEGLPADVTIRHIGLLDDGSVWMVGGPKVGEAWLRGPHGGKFVAVAMDDLWSRAFGARAADASPAIVSRFNALFSQTFQSFARGPTGAVWHLGGGLGRMHWSEAGGKRIFVDDVFPEEVRPHALTTILRDREGNVWVGNVDGIEKISATRLHALAPRQVLLNANLTRSPTGEVWIGAYEGHGVYRASSGTVSEWRSEVEDITALFADKLGGLWIFNFDMEEPSAHGNDIEHVEPNGVHTHLAYPPTLKRSPVAIADAPTGGLLISTPQGFFRYADGAWSEGLGRKDMPVGPALRLVADPLRGMWLSYPSGDIALMEEGRATIYPARDVALGTVFAIDPGKDRTWLAGDTGIAYIKDGHVTAPLAGSANPFVGARGILQARIGDLWINAARGVYRIDKAGVADLQRGSLPQHSSMDLFTDDDGLQGSIPDIIPALPLVEGADGRIWMSRLDGVSWLDPKTLLRNTVPAQAYVESVLVDGQQAPAGQSVTIPPGTQHMQVNFTAPSLTRPDRVTFRYRLQGVDRAWQDATNRRFALYSNLSPGTYRFDVIAFNEDGLSTGEGATVRLQVLPTVYQSWWFRSICLALAMAIVALVYAVRLRSAREKLRLRLEATHEERERIARDLHDTLMQSVQGLALQVHGWSEGNNDDPEEQRRAMRRAADAAQAAVREGRDKILELRASDANAVTLLDELRGTVEEFALIHPQSFDLAEAGRPSTLVPAAFEDVLEVAREGIRNAVLHSNARIVTVRIRYDTDALTLTICDDGDGLPASVAEAGYLEGRWGLVGMRERAHRLQARLSLFERVAGGTEMHLVVPGRVAYGRRRSRFLAPTRGWFGHR